MGRPKKLNPDRPLASAKITAEAMEAAKIAAPMKGMTVQDYVSAATIEIAQRDMEEFARNLNANKVPSKSKQKED